MKFERKGNDIPSFYFTMNMLLHLNNQYSKLDLYYNNLQPRENGSLVDQVAITVIKFITFLLELHYCYEMVE